MNTERLSAILATAKVADELIDYTIKACPHMAPEIHHALQFGSHMKVSLEYESERPTVEVLMVAPDGSEIPIIRNASI